MPESRMPESRIPEPKSWESMLDQSTRLLRDRTGVGLEEWNRRVRESGISTEHELRDWLARRGVTGYAQMMLVMERFGYPDFLLASADELIDAQYGDRPELRPVCDAVLAAAVCVGDVTVQARKGYISLVTPKRTFAVVRAATRDRVDLGLKLAHQRPGSRLLAASSSLPHATVRIALRSPEEVDEEVLDLLARAYEENS